jgi:hypothetical protein
MAPIREEEARYRVMELVKRRPNLTTLLFNLLWQGAEWSAALEKLPEAADESPDEPLGESGLPLLPIMWACSSLLPWLAWT